MDIKALELQLIALGFAYRSATRDRHCWWIAEPNVSIRIYLQQYIPTSPLHMEITVKFKPPVDMWFDKNRYHEIVPKVLSLMKEGTK